mmetsp:Transcript_2927/g.11994  ORF Transcript_2927/g.11994 Transcript_2927/m.11994 type:complete len:247 (+) Transcript_2927:246-986(+)
MPGVKKKGIQSAYSASNDPNHAGMAEQVLASKVGAPCVSPLWIIHRCVRTDTVTLSAKAHASCAMSEPDAAPVPTTSTRASARSLGSLYSDECTTAPVNDEKFKSSGTDGAASWPVHTHTASNTSVLDTLTVAGVVVVAAADWAARIERDRFSARGDVFCVAAISSASITSSNPFAVSTHDVTSDRSLTRFISPNFSAKDLRYFSVCSCPRYIGQSLGGWCPANLLWVFVTFWSTFRKTLLRSGDA